MFGKLSLKCHGKAFIACHGGNVVFKLPQPDHERAMAHSGALLWDPSGKKRPMKEWVALPGGANGDFVMLADRAFDYALSNSGKGAR